MARKAAATSGCAAVFFAGLLLAGEAVAGELKVDGNACADRLTIAADQVPLGKLLQEVANTLDFTYKSGVALDGLVSISRAGPPVDLIKSIFADHNLVLETGPKTGCAGANSVTRLWILPAGENAVDVVSPDVHESATRIEHVPPKNRGERKSMGMSKAEWKRAKKEARAAQDASSSSGSEALMESAGSEAR